MVIFHSYVSLPEGNDSWGETQPTKKQTGPIVASVSSPATRSPVRSPVLGDGHGLCIFLPGPMYMVGLYSGIIYSSGIRPMIIVIYSGFI